MSEMQVDVTGENRGGRCQQVHAWTLPQARTAGLSLSARLSAAICLLALAMTSTGCPGDAVGDPCIPETIPLVNGSPGFDRNQIYIEASSVQCRTRICLVDKFTGDPRNADQHTQAPPDANPSSDYPFQDCPPPSEASEASEAPTTPRTRLERTCCDQVGDCEERAKQSNNGELTAEASLGCKAAFVVCSNTLIETATLNDKIYCSCRCDGPKTSLEFCECGEGFSCKEALTINAAGEGLRGSYCMKD